jgi:hypothetical protein
MRDGDERSSDGEDGGGCDEGVLLHGGGGGVSMVQGASRGIGLEFVGPPQSHFTLSPSPSSRLHSLLE